MMWEKGGGAAQTNNLQPLLDKGETKMKANWKKDYAGRYISTKTGWIIERSCEGGWLVINKESGGIADSFKTKKEAQKYYE